MLPFACLPEQHLRHLPADDLFYYLESARRTAATGAWPSMDGAYPTSGFHPLFFLICWGLTKLAPMSLLTPMRCILGFNLAVAAGCMALAARQVPARADSAGEVDVSSGHRRLAVLGVLFIFLLNPFWTAQALAGVETMLSVALLLWLLGRWLLRRERLELADWSWPFIVADGVILGLAGLARTDNALLGLGFGLAFLAEAPRRSGPVLVRLAGLGAVAVAVTSPWLLLLLWQQGSIVQDSARALHARHSFEIAAGILSPWEVSGRQVMFWLYRLGHVLGSIPLSTAVAGLLLGAGRRPTWDRLRPEWLLATAEVAGLLPLLSANTVWDLKNPLHLAAELGLGGLFFGLGLLCPTPLAGRAAGQPLLLWLPIVPLAGLYTLYLGHFQLWYTASSTLLLLLLTGPVLVRALAPARWPPIVMLILAIMTGFGLRTFQTITDGTYRVPRDEGISDHELRERLELLFPVSSRPVVGSFDSGLLSYRLHPYPVANLDGVMNHEAARALEERRLGDFLDRSGIVVILGSEERVRYFAVLGSFDFERDAAASQALSLEVFRIKGRHAASPRVPGEKPDVSHQPATASPAPPPAGAAHPSGSGRRGADRAAQSGSRAASPRLLSELGIP